jgi:hypothetical protein
MAQSSVTFYTDVKDLGFLLVFKQNDTSETTVLIAHICEVKQHTNHNTEIKLINGSTLIFSHNNNDLYEVLKNIIKAYYDGIARQVN